MVVAGFSAVAQTNDTAETTSSTEELKKLSMGEWWRRRELNPRP